uniref:Uncharacterized protein n=1 Tax=Leersia perrieri TaxID=77586 RepID=A0A0D9XGM9_9ORYZ
MVATTFPYRWTRTKHLTISPPTHGAGHLPPPWILLDITICIAPPPLVSYICAWSPGNDPANIFAKEPYVGSVNADLLFLR